MLAIALGAALAYAGFVGLCLATRRPYRALQRPEPGGLARLGWRIGGAGALALAWAACVAGPGWSFGTVAWCCLISVAGIALVFLLGVAPRLALLLALGAPALALLWLVGPVPY